MSIRELLRENIRSLEPYSSARDDFSGTASVFLDANENWQDFVDFDNINRYPDPHSSAVKKAVSEAFGYDERMVSIGNGSDELISIICGCFLEKQDKVLTLSPDFSMYAFYSELYELQVVSMPKGDDLRIDVSKVPIF